MKPAKPKSPTSTPLRPRTADPVDVWRLFGSVADLFRVVARQHSEPDHVGRLTVNQARIFGYIFDHHQERLRLKDLAHNLAVSTAAVSQAVDRLVRAGLVERKTDPRDRRAIEIRISRRGRDLLEEWQAVAVSMMDSLYAGVPREDVEAFFRVFLHIHDGLRARWKRIVDARAAED